VAQKSQKSGRAGKTNGPKAASPRGKSAAPPAPGKRRRGRPTRQEQSERSRDYAQVAGDHVIHRYGNRRYYDLEARRAVTLDEVAGFVRRGDSVRVIDVDNGNEDITRRVLTQIILEEGNRDKLELLPIEFLRKLISAQDSSVATWLDQYLRAGAEMMDRSLRGGLPAVTAFQDRLSKLVQDTLSGIDRYGMTYTEMADADRRKQEIDDLRRRLDDLAKQK
jgi:polyhydroxyalkanoate synthesis repressor PhaR